MQPNASETCATGSEMVRNNRTQEHSEDVRRGRLQHYADIIAEGNLDEDEKMDQTRVLDVRHGRLHFQSERERTTILEGNVVERSNRSLIVPEELRNHVKSSIGRERRVRFWNCQDPDLDNGASNKVEGETDVTNRSGLMVAAGFPPPSQDVMATCWK